MPLREQILELNGLEKFNPMQQLVLKQDWQKKSLVVSSPTASGKTLIAELLSLNSIINKKKKVVYTCPLRALASEHFSEFKKKYSKLNIRAGLSTGDLDSSSKHLQNYDFIFTTYEKLDSMIRHRAEWLSEVGLLVIDEVHEIDSGRGATLEVTACKLMQMNPKMQVLALSATIPNANEIAKWLNAKLVQSDYRPIPLREGVHFNHEISYADGKPMCEKIEGSNALEAIAKDTIQAKGKQLLSFANTRRNAEGMAKRLSSIASKGLSTKEKASLKKDADAILHALEAPTEQCKNLAALIEDGAAFHHAGLMHKQRTIVEDAFKANRLKLISATPTLCVVPETRLWHGIEDFRVDSLGHNQRLLALKNNKLTSLRPQAILKRENDKKIVGIKSCSGFSIKLTENHRVLVKRNGQKQLLAAGKCKKGDKIAVVGKLWKKRPEKFDINYFSTNPPNPELPLNEDFFYFIGAMLGDGYSGVEKKVGKLLFKGTPCLVGHDREIFQVAKRACDFYGIKYRERKNHYGIPSLSLSKAKWFRTLLVHCGVQKGSDKFIAQELMLGNRTQIKSLVQGLFDTDGYVQKGKNIGFSNISLSLIKGLQRLLLLFGIVSRFRERPAGTIQITRKKYKTKKYFELLITQKGGIINFRKRIGFRVKRKQDSLSLLADSISSNVYYISCPVCKYKLFADLFSGRTKQQADWGEKKLSVIRVLGQNTKLTSSELTKKLGFRPYKKERRLNNHFELIDRVRAGNSKQWDLNEVGKHIYRQLFLKEKSFEKVIKQRECPICRKKLLVKLKGGWRKNDFEGDIFWDFITEVSIENAASNPFVFDVVLPSNNSNSHLFVAEGFIIHNSAGINLPAHTVVIPSLYRFEAVGMTRIPVREYKQMVGRAGRPKYDIAGRGVVIAKNENEKEELLERYVEGEIEEITSKLGIEPILRMHLLALIAANFVYDLGSMEEFFKTTFYARQYGDLATLFAKVQGILEELEEWKFIESDEKKIVATPLGKRVSELYLDPLTAHTIVESFSSGKKFHLISYLFLFAQSTEFMPWLSVPKAKEPELQEEMQLNSEFLPINVEKEMYFDLNLIRKFNSSLLLEEWLSEKSEQDLLHEFRTQPGTLHSKLLICDWLAYSSLELARLLNLELHYAALSKLRKRLKYGVKEELLILTEVRGIGRVRARRLWRANIRTIAALKKVDKKDLERILGVGVASQIKQQLGQI